MNRIRILLLAALLSAVSAAGIYAQADLSSAFESLKTYAPAASSEETPAVPQPVAEAKERLSGEQLFQQLHNATAPRIAGISSYQQAKSFMYSKADNVGCGGGPGIITFYSQVCAKGSSSNGNDYHEQGDQNSDGVVDKIVNAEHLWPQSYFGKSLPMVADVHQIASTFETPNGRRANLRFTLVSKAIYSTSSGSKLGSDGFEPTDAVKGNVARAMLYFVVRYYDRSIRQGMDYNSFWTSRIPMFLEWNRQDPPDAAERRRNDLVEEFQGNRNPFIDDPSLADQIGVAVFAAH